MQTALTISVPTLVILLGILYSRQDYARLDVKMDGLRSELSSKIDAQESNLSAQINELRSYMREFYRILGQHDARLDSLERDRKA